MAHTKQQGAAARNVNVPGKRLGVKRFGGQMVNEGTIIVKQRGTKFHVGRNTDKGRDFTIYSKTKGVVSFRKMGKYHKGQSYVDVIPADQIDKKETKKTTKK